jgi:Xaa-Pro aminopeptidase
VEIAGWAGGYGFSAARVQAVGSASAEQEAHLAHLAEAVEWMRESLQPRKPVGYVMTVHREQRIMPAAHGIGLDIFEYPWILPGPGPKKHQVPPGSVLCVEPIMTNTRFGSVSIKRTVLVDEDGPRFLDE